MNRSLRPCTLLAVAASAAVVAAPASASTPHSQIVGGSRAPSTAWEVQLVFSQDGGTYGCTGEQLNSAWVLTAKHCVDGVSAMTVYQSNSVTHPGTGRRADRWVAAPRGDLGLVHLATASAVASYAPVALGSYTVRSTGTGTIMGFGLRANQQQPDGLYQATVSLTGAGTDAYDGRGQHVTGSSGASNHGDSGGPLLVGGKVVAVCSTGDSADPGSDIHAGATYAVLSQSGSWIASTAGL